MGGEGDNRRQHRILPSYTIYHYIPSYSLKIKSRGQEERRKREKQNKSYLRTQVSLNGSRFLKQRQGCLGLTTACLLGTPSSLEAYIAGGLWQPCWDQRQGMKEGKRKLAASSKNTAGTAAPRPTASNFTPNPRGFPKCQHPKLLRKTQQPRPATVNKQTFLVLS